VAHTVAVGMAHRAMALLKDEGLIEVTRRRRAAVSTGGDARLARHGG
jgi:hypothetical protein